MRTIPSHYFRYRNLDLQLFSDGGAGASASSGDGATGVTAADAGSQNNGVSAEKGAVPTAEVQGASTHVGADDRTAKFEEMIRGEYKDLYDAKVQDTVRKRLKGTQETVQRYEALSPVLEMIARKYGVDSSDAEAILTAMEEDDSYFEEEALERGMTVEQVKEFRKMERENAALKREKADREARENADRTYAQWMEQANATKQIYPQFDLRAEMSNSQFVSLLRSNIDVRTAYEVVHNQEIIAGAMQFTAQKVQDNLSRSIIAGGARPTENGNSSQGAVSTVQDVSKMTPAQRREIARRVAAGEIISFG